MMMIYSFQDATLIFVVTGQLQVQQQVVGKENEEVCLNDMIDI